MMPPRIPHKFIDGVEHKWCSKCKRYLPLDKFGLDSAQRDKLHGYCKKCVSKNDRKYRRDLKEGKRVVTRKSPLRVEHKFAEDGTELKYCSGCDSWKVLNEFSRSKAEWDAFCTKCKKCLSEYLLRYRREVLGIMPRVIREHKFIGDVEYRQCSRCDEWLLLDNFGKDNGKRDGLHYWCKTCISNCAHDHRIENPEAARERDRQWRENNPGYMTQFRKDNPEKAKDYDLFSSHGIRLKEYNALLKSQNGVCRICHQPEVAEGKSFLSVDHIKGTEPKIIRGLLCSNCNPGLGHINHSVITMRLAVDYLEYWKNRRNPNLPEGVYKSNISAKQRQDLHDLHNGLCDICHQPEVAPNKSLAVDHDHATGEIRGLLCNLCNTGLGLMKDSTVIINSAIDYLERSKLAEPVTGG